MSTLGTLEWLRRYESRNVTFIEGDGSWPIVWEKAQGMHVWDAAGRKYLDLTAAFGVAAAGHANLRVVQAGQSQMARLLHAMGDVHPHARKAELAKQLSRLTFQRWGAGPGKTILCNSGFEAVEAALKTAMLATGRERVVAFEGAYHGLGYGALNATHRSHFRSPFRRQLKEFARFAPFPMSEAELRKTTAEVKKALVSGRVGAVLLEPIQARGGIRVSPPQFLNAMRRLCDHHQALLIVDEVYTGFGRTGRWFACEHSAVVPDLICLGKALTGGFPLSACVGRAALMDRAWPQSKGEAIHTSTFLGHPVGCAMALAQIGEIERSGLVRRSATCGRQLLALLRQLRRDSGPLRVVERGVGLLAGLELRHADGVPATDAAMKVIKAMLRRGFILLPEGEHANVISFSPPLIISERQLDDTVSALGEEIDSLVRSHT
jgi:4-aminobutyrate aminotransferase-like enzyme